MINQQREILEKMKFNCMGDVYKFHSKLKRVNKAIFPENQQQDNTKKPKINANQNR